MKAYSMHMKESISCEYSISQIFFPNLDVVSPTIITECGGKQMDVTFMAEKKRPSPAFFDDHAKESLSDPCLQYLEEAYFHLTFTSQLGFEAHLLHKHS